MKSKEKSVNIIVLSLLFLLLLFSILYLIFFNKNINVLENKNVYFAYYIDGQPSEDLPKQNTEYTLDTNASTCTNGVIPSWDYATWQFIGNYSNYQETNKRTKCELYFVKNKTVQTALGELSVYPYTPDYTKSACDDEICESHEKGIYETTDEEGTSYYYRGSVENNYLEFAGYYWRVVRINGDGTIRIIYDGTKGYRNGEVNEDRQVGVSKFNSSNTRNEYVGYMYTLGEVHGTDTSSTIKEANDEFYVKHLATYSEYIDTNAGFCGDRSTLNLQNGVGTGTVTTYYKGYLRMIESTPSLLCENTSDLYTHTSSNKGNKALTSPVGLITMDEMLLAGTGGGVFNGSYNHTPSSVNNYLNLGISYWTMTPIGGYNTFGGTGWVSFIFYLHSFNLLDDHDPTYSNGLRPTINLKSDLEFTGDGTIDNAYKIKAE